jgi:hypothetical protein
MQVKSNSKLAEAFDKIQTLYNVGVRKNLLERKTPKFKTLSFPYYIPKRIDKTAESLY